MFTHFVIKARASDNQAKSNITTNSVLHTSAPSDGGHQKLLGTSVRTTTTRLQPDRLWAAPLTILGHSISHRGPTSHRGDGGQPGDEGGYTLFSSAPSPRPSRPYSARPRLYALPVEEGERRVVAEGMLRVGHVSTYICGSWSPIPRVVRSEVSFSVLGEAWENPPPGPH